ncbi:hypothetical protein ACSSS7_002908 [Eimeria intestinalis]
MAAPPSRGSSGGLRAPPRWSLSSSFHLVFVLAALLTLSFLCCSYWLGAPNIPPQSSTLAGRGAPGNEDVAGNVSNWETDDTEGAHSRTLAVSLLAGINGVRPIGGPYSGASPVGVSATYSQRKKVLFPSPTFGIAADAPFTFHPMQALSAPPTAMSFIKASSVLEPVELYAVKHACTLTISHHGLKRGRGALADPPFVQGLQATGRHHLIESSGLYKQSYVREVKLNVHRDGHAISSIDFKTERVFFSFEEHFNEGVALFYSTSLERLLMLLLTWKANLIYVIDYESFACVGNLKAADLEGWGFASSLDLTFYKELQDALEEEAEANAAGVGNESRAATAAAVVEVARRRLLKHAREQQLWVTTGGPELIEVSIQSIEDGIAAHTSSILAAIRQEEREQQQRRYHRNPFKEIKPTPRCKMELGAIEVERTSFVHCLGQVFVGLNELEYNKDRHTLLANLYGLPAVIEIHPHSGACQSLISLSGVSVVEKNHEEDHRVMNAVAIPFDAFGDPLYLHSSSGPPGVPALFIAGKEWPSVALVQLRRLRAGDKLEMEARDSRDSHACEQEEDNGNNNFFEGSSSNRNSCSTSCSGTSNRCSRAAAAAATAAAPATRTAAFVSASSEGSAASARRHAKRLRGGGSIYDRGAFVCAQQKLQQQKLQQQKLQQQKLQQQQLHQRKLQQQEGS